MQGGALEDVRIVTLAPEIPGAMGIISELKARGAVVSAGYSLATASLAEQAVQRGAAMVTSIFSSGHAVRRVFFFPWAKAPLRPQGASFRAIRG